MCVSLHSTLLDESGWGFLLGLSATMELPSTCTLASVKAGSACTASLPFPSINTTIQFAADTCSLSRLPYLSVHCEGLLCQSLFRCVLLSLHYSIFFPLGVSLALSLPAVRFLLAKLVSVLQLKMYQTCAADRNMLSVRSLHMSVVRALMCTPTVATTLHWQTLRRFQRLFLWHEVQVAGGCGRLRLTDEVAAHVGQQRGIDCMWRRYWSPIDGTQICSEGPIFVCIRG